MKYNNKKHIKLVKQSLNFKNQNKEIFLEDSKASRELTYYEISLYNYLCWTQKSDFVLLMQNYIESSMTSEEFEIAFSCLWTSTMEEFERIRLDLKRLKNFHPNPESVNCGSYITGVYRQFEDLEDEVFTEQEARDYIIHILDRLNSLDDILLIEDVLSNLPNYDSLTSTIYNDNEVLQSIMVFLSSVSVIAYFVLNPTLFNLIWQ